MSAKFVGLVRCLVISAAAFVSATSTIAATPTTAVPAPTPTPTPTQPSVLVVSPSATLVTVSVVRIDRSLPILAARIAVVARDGTGIVRTARSIDDPSLLQTREQPRFVFVFDPPLEQASEPYTVEATALDFVFGGSEKIIVESVPTDIGRLGDPFIATWWSAGVTPGKPFVKRALSDGGIAYMSRDGKQRIPASRSGFYPEFADEDVTRLRSYFYGHDALGSGVAIRCQTRGGAAMDAHLVLNRRVRIEEIGRAAHASERISGDPTKFFGSGVFVDSPIVVEFGLAPGDATIEWQDTYAGIQQRFDSTCVRGFVLFRSAAQMLAVFSRA